MAVPVSLADGGFPFSYGRYRIGMDLLHGILRRVFLGKGNAAAPEPYRGNELQRSDHRIYCCCAAGEISGLQVYVLCGEKEKRVLPEDLHRIYWLRDNGFAPYVMLFDKDNIPRGSDLKQLQRWVNNRFVFWKTERFEDYDPNEYRMKNL